MTVSSPQIARQSMRAAALLLTLVLIAGAPLTLVAEPPAQQQTQVPGFYRLVLGEFEVTALYDGSIELSPALLNGISEEGLQSCWPACSMWRTVAFKRPSTAMLSTPAPTSSW